VIAGARDAEAEFGVVTRLIASFNRHESIQVAAEVARLAAERQHLGIVGLDLAGNEADFSALPFRGVLADARAAGLHLTLHAGEWGPAANVVEAIDLGAERIGHGVRVLDDPQATMKARAAGIPFEVCLTSNYQSGVVPLGRVHPLPRMLALGLNATLNTDDPSISQIRLSDEYRLAVDDLGLSLAALRERVLAAAEASFLPNTERAALVARLRGEIAAFQRTWA
jgi:adenosine deaminase